MVYITRHLYRTKKQFLESLRVYVRGGTGGQGLAKYNGIGGRGGDIFVVGNEDASLKRIIALCPTKRFSAPTGEDSSGRALQGAPGAPIEIHVPFGVTVKTDFGTALGDINKAGDKVLVARGGDGGMLSNRFVGQKGDALSVTLDLKVISDIGFVGFPNAGKSTLLKALSQAKPRIASYPFTTIQPQLGMMEYEDHRQISVADLPGLVEGAHNNVGMGHKFLKHVERTKMLAFVVDLLGFRLSVKHELRSAFENVVLLNKELELYKPELVSKPAILILNKIDIKGAEKLRDVTVEKVKHIQEHMDEINEDFRPENFIEFDDIVTVSAKRRQNIDELKQQFRRLLDLHADIQQNVDTLLDQRWEALQRYSSEHYGTHLV